MEKHDEILEALKRIEANQVKALQVQQEHVAIARAQIERSERAISESVALQKVSVRRQAFAIKVALPLTILLLVLLGYLLIKWRVF
jgi:hypothetical protein